MKNKLIARDFILKANTSEYLSEESRVLAAEAEVEMYMEEVDDLRFAVERLDARLKLLEARRNVSPNKDSDA